MTACTVSGFAYSAAKKIGLEFLTESQQDELWKRTDLYASLNSYLHACDQDIDFERRFVAAVQMCVTEPTIHQVVMYYRQRYRAYLTKLQQRQDACNNEYLISHHVAEKAKHDLNSRISEAKRYCDFYLQTQSVMPH